jgi:hypothetical protein
LAGCDVAQAVWEQHGSDSHAAYCQSNRLTTYFAPGAQKQQDKWE